MFKLFSRHSKYSHPFTKIKNYVFTRDKFLYTMIFNVQETIAETYNMIFNVFEETAQTYSMIFNVSYTDLNIYNMIFNVTTEVVDTEFNMIFNVYEEAPFGGYNMIFNVYEAEEGTSDCSPIPCLNN